MRGKKIILTDQKIYAVVLVILVLLQAYSIFNISNKLNTPEIVDFIFEDGTTVTVNINEIGGQYESNI